MCANQMADQSAGSVHYQGARAQSYYSNARLLSGAVKTHTLGHKLYAQIDHTRRALDGDIIYSELCKTARHQSY